MLRRAIFLGALACAAASCFLPTYEVGDATATSAATETATGTSDGSGGATAGGGVNAGGAGVGGGVGGAGGASTGPTLPTTSSSSVGGGGSTHATLTWNATSPRSLTTVPGTLYWIDDLPGNSVIEQVATGVGVVGSPAHFHMASSHVFCSIDAGSDFVLARTTDGAVYKVTTNEKLIIAGNGESFAPDDPGCKVSLFPNGDAFAFFSHGNKIHPAIQRVNATTISAPTIETKLTIHKPGTLWAHAAGRLAVSDVGAAASAGAYEFTVDGSALTIKNKAKMTDRKGSGLCNSPGSFFGTGNDTVGFAFEWDFAASHTPGDALNALPIVSGAGPVACNDTVIAYGVYGTDPYVEIDRLDGAWYHLITPSVTSPCSVAVASTGQVFFADCVANGAIYKVDP